LLYVCNRKQAIMPQDLKKKKMKQFKVINRISRKEQVFNSEELQRFFKYLGNGKYNNQWKDYAVSVVETEDNFLENVAISLVAVCSVILTTKIIMLWI
jgi:hypothetical protein